MLKFLNILKSSIFSKQYFLRNTLLICLIILNNFFKISVNLEMIGITLTNWTFSKPWMKMRN